MANAACVPTESSLPLNASVFGSKEEPNQMSPTGGTSALETLGPVLLGAMSSEIPPMTMSATTINTAHRRALPPVDGFGFAPAPGVTGWLGAAAGWPAAVRQKPLPHVAQKRCVFILS